MCLFKCTTGSLSEKPIAVNVLTSPQKLLQYAEKYFYPTFSSFRPKLSYKRLFLIRSEILGLLDNTLTGNYEYSRYNRENLPLPNETKLSKKL